MLSYEEMLSLLSYQTDKRYHSTTTTKKHGSIFYYIKPKATKKQKVNRDAFELLIEQSDNSNSLNHQSTNKGEK